MRTIESEEQLLLTSRPFEDTQSLWRYCLNESSKDGLFLEFGVYEGGSINFMSSYLPQTKFYGFDSFDGLPEFWREGYDKGFFKVEKIPVVNNNVEIIVGLFQESLEPFLFQHTESVSFCHIDCDLYSSSKYVIEKLLKRFIKGSILLFDELYNYPGYENGELKSLVEIANSYDLQYEYIGYNKNHEQAAIKIF